MDIILRDRNLNVLLVEDNPGDQDLILEWLSESSTWQFKVTVASTLAHALDALSSAEFGAVLLDLSLPDSQGFETIARVRAHCPAVPILVLSGMPSEAMRLEAVRAGAQDFFSKEESPEILLAKGLVLAVERHYAQVQDRYLNTLVAESPDAVLVVTGEHKIDFVNRAAETLFNHPAEELIGETFMFEVAEGALSEINIPHDDAPRRGQMRVSAIVWKDAPGWMVTIRDLTEYRQMEEVARQAQKLDAIGVLAAGVAHDFNNLLTIINGYTEMLLAEETFVDTHRQMLEGIEEAGLRAASLTRQLLAFGRKSVLSVEEFDINQVVREISRMLERLIGEDLILEVVLCNAPCWVQADPSHIEQILVNLAVNARDAMPQGGAITISTEHTHPGSGRDEYVRLCLTDTGPGIPADIRDKIFQPFFTTKEVGRGTGLGLSTVYGIVEQMGGHIDFECPPGGGTRFRVDIPALAATSMASKAPEQRSTEDFEGSETILLVEDEARVREVTAHALGTLGYTVLAAENGEVGLAMAGQYTATIHLVITDMVMPGMNGVEFARQLRLSRPRAKVLFTTGYTDDAIERCGGASGKINLLQKPFRFRTLAERVRGLIDDAPAPAAMEADTPAGKQYG